MSARFLTVLVVRHGHARFRTLRISYLGLTVVTTVTVALAAAGLYAPSLVLRVQEQAVVIDRLAHENSRLRGEKDHFEGAVAQLSDRLGAFEEQAGRLARELGVEQGPPAAGGPLGDPPLSAHVGSPSELSFVQARAEWLDRSFEGLGAAFEERRSVLAATPDGMPVQGWLSDGFGWRKDPFTGERQFHRGIDIVAPAGTEIRAAADGVVSQTGVDAEYGRNLDVNHGHGFVTRYAHLTEALVRPGERVRRGDPIGRVGSTGRSTGPHLHYEVFRDGRRVNPWTYLGER
jgi:murein DD-endopeptidase MepM/ murein hydrolase activator NlpD